MARDVFASDLESCRGLQLFIQLPAEHKVPNWNSNGLKPTVTASEAVANALDKATTTTAEPGTQYEGNK